MTNEKTGLPEKREETALARVPELTFTKDQIDLIKRTIAKGSTDDELALFLYHAKKAGLDPLARQIHLVKRGDNATIQTGIDGYRLLALRTGDYAGNDTPTFTWAKSEQTDSHPTSAHVTVYRFVRGKRCGFSAEADWDFFYPGEKQGFMWRRGKGKFMLGKCAEALALRKAFPAELSGIYTHEEMEQARGMPVAIQQADNEPAPSPTADPWDSPDGQTQADMGVVYVDKVKALAADMKVIGEWWKANQRDIDALPALEKVRVMAALSERKRAANATPEERA